MLKNKKQYWIKFSDILRTGNNIEQLIPELLKDLCRVFDFGCGFIYEADHYGQLHLMFSFQGYADYVIKDKIQLTEQLGDELLAQFAAQPMVSFRAVDKKGPLEEALCCIFGESSMMLALMVNDDASPLALTGLVDRRRQSRYTSEDIDFARSVMTTLSTYIKMMVYRRRAEDAQKSLEGVLDNMGIDVYVNDFETHEVLYANRSMAAPYGGVKNMLGRPCWKTLYDDKDGECDFCPQKKLIDDEGNPSKVYSWDYLRPFDASWFRVFSAAFRWTDGRMAHIVSSVDITENKRNEEIIRQIAEYDHLTGLPNRLRLTHHIESKMKVAGKDTEGYLIFFDLDGFKAVNDNFGHDKGDALLVCIGEALQANPLTHDQCYRFGGDEFIVTWDSDCPGTIMDTIESIQNIFSRSWRLGDDVVNVGVSIGVSRFPSDADTSGSLIRMADIAMYSAKRTGPLRVHFYNRGNIIPAAEYFMLQK